MYHNSFDLVGAIRGLAAIDADGRLSELLMDHANECRRRGLPLDRQLHDPDADFAARMVGRAASQLFGLAAAECEAATRDVLRLHPRRDAALELIAEYVGRDEAEQTASIKLARERRRTA